MAISQQDLMNLYKSGKISSDTFNKLSPPLKMADGGMVNSLQSGHPLDVIHVNSANPKFKSSNNNNNTSDAGQAVGLASGTPVNASENDTTNSASNTAADGALVGSEGDIPIDQSMNNPTTSDVNVATGTPQGQPVMAFVPAAAAAAAPIIGRAAAPIIGRAVAAGAPAAAGPTVSGTVASGGIPNGLNLGLKMFDGANDSATQSSSQNATKNTFEDNNTKNLQNAIKNNIPNSHGAINSIATEQETTAAPVSGEGLKQQRDQNQKNAEFFKTLQQQFDEATNAQTEARAKLKNLTDNAFVDPENYVNQLGVSGKTVTAIGLLLSGIGSGLTGQPNMAMNVLQNNINRDINAQKQNIQDQMKQVALDLDLSTSVVNTAQAKLFAQHLATITTISGVKAANESAMQHVTNKTALARGDLLKNQFDVDLMREFNNIDSLHMGTIQAGQSDTQKLMTGMLYNYAKNGSIMRPDLVNTQQFNPQNNKQPRLNLGVNKPQIEQYQPAQPAEKPGFLDKLGMGE